MRTVVAVVCLALGAVACGAAPIDVRSLGAVGDGKADDTAAFEAAIKQAAPSKTPVLVPGGLYRVSRPLVLQDLALVGPDGGAWPADSDSLPVIIPTHVDGPCVELKAGGALKGLCIRYEWKSEPEEGPAAVLISGIGAYVSCVKVMYPWDGIIADGINNVGRVNIENVFMVSPRNVGVRITGTWDVPALRNVEVWNAGPVARALEKGIGFDLGKNDLIRVTDCFVFAMQTGFLLRDKIPGAKIEGGTWGLLTGCSTDYCGYGVVVRGENTVSITGGTFWQHAESLVVEGAKARVRVAGAELKSNGAPTVRVMDADHVVISGCGLMRPMEGFDAPAVVLRGGRVTLTGCHLVSMADGIHVLEGIKSALVQGCTIESVGPAVADRHGAGGTVSISGNIELKAVPPKPEPAPAK